MSDDNNPASPAISLPEPGAASLWHRLRYTPLRDVLRGHMSARLDARLVIANAKLPKPLADVTWRVVRGTRLWRSEKVAVAEELTSHFLDGIDAGTPADELLTAFGNPRVAAKLIRRAKKRARSWTWKGFQWTAFGTIVILLIYLLLWGSLYLRQPATPTKYYAEIESMIATRPSAQNGWPEYQRIYATYDLASININDLYDWGKFQPPTPTDPKWARAEAVLAQYRSAINELYRVAEYQYADAPLGYWVRASDEDIARFKRPGSQDYRYTTDAPLESLPLTVPLNNGSALVDPSLHAALLMNSELNSAVHNSDRERTLRASRALVGFIRQAANSYEHVWSSNSRALRVASGLSRSLVYVLDNDSQWLTNEDLTEIAHLIASLQSIYHPSMTLNRLMAFDRLERMYDVNGRITLVDSLGDFRPSFNRDLEGMLECRWLGVLLGNDLVGKQVGASVAFPVLMNMVGSRDDMCAEVERYISATERDLQKPLWELDASGTGSAFYLRKTWDASFMNKVHYLPLQYVSMDIYISALQLKRQQAYQEALLTRLALEMYLRRDGRYPSTLAALAPIYLPSTPIDHSTGLPLLMKLDEAGKPILYGRGRDGDDDGGIPGEDAKTYREPRKDGDWIMLPSTWY